MPMAEKSYSTFFFWVSTSCMTGFGWMGHLRPLLDFHWYFDTYSQGMPRQIFHGGKYINANTRKN
jgi:hypothetical protein